MTHNRMRRGLVVLGTMLVLSLGPALAWVQYSVSKTSGYCADCHGGFRSKPYTELGTGLVWSDSLHNVHQDMVSSDCDVCHLASGKFPTRLGESAGGTLLDPVGCAGCHGRAEDGIGSGAVGWSAGQRQHHDRAGISSCVGCHADSDPTAFTPVGEDVRPPYYVDGGGSAAYPLLSQDPCSDPGNALSPEEDFDGASRGLDNDGDLAFDMLDSDCAGVVESPGETAGQGLALMEITGHDAGARTMDITYGATCAASENTIVYGPLDQLFLYGYTGVECYCGNTESFTWTGYPHPDIVDSFFFLIVANDGVSEGSYGLRTGGIERPWHDWNLVCPMPQELADRCD